MKEEGGSVKNRRISGRLRVMKTILCAAVLVSIVVGTVSGCAYQSAPEDDNGTLTVAVSSDTGTMDPAGSIALTFLSYSASALDELVTFDENGEIIYRAAESYEVNEDYALWTFHLREDGLWSDGSPVTSKDFLNTITRALDPVSGSGYANYLFHIENAEEIYNGEKSMDELGVETPDDNTIIFHLNAPCVYFLDLLRLPVYMPSNEKYAESVSDGWDKNPETSLANGPFKMTEYVPEQSLTLEKNENYWDADEIKLDRIVYRFFSDQQSMANAYEAGEVDVATSLQSEVMERYEGSEDLMVTDLIATRYIYPNLDVEPLDDVRVRKAISLAINREELCSAVGKDTSPTYNLVSKYMTDKTTGEYFVDGATQPFEEDVEEARRLLAEAGYPDGEGFPVLTYKYPTLEMDSDTAQVIKEQLKQNLNIDINLQAQELQTNYSDRHAKNFELCRMNWTADFADPDTYLSMLLSNSTYNCSNIADEEYDSLVLRAQTETDAKTRMELMHEAELYAVGEQFYVIPLYGMQSCNLVNPDVTGIRQIAASGALEYRYAEKK